jgi:hypothetical protein
MKSIAGILAVLTGLMMIQPLLAEFGLPAAYESCPAPVEDNICPASAAENKCALQTSCNQPEPCKNKKEGRTKGCNPFLGCSSGNFYIHSYSTIALHHVIILNTKKALVNDNRTRKQSNECWHPPEQVS